jgi:hypothetical protein
MLCCLHGKDKKRKAAASLSAWAGALGEEGFHKKQPTFFTECPGQARGEEFLLKKKIFPECCTREEGFF